VRVVGRFVGRLVQLLAVVVSLALVAVLVLVAITTSRGLPETTGTLTVAGLHDPVDVVRDASGIIHVTAEDRHDLFVAQGYVHAQERMWQMELSRRIGAGRLSELFGRSTLDKDRYIRTLGWRVAAQRDLAAMSPDSVAVLEAYSEGVNAWITEHDGRLSTPFVVAGLLSGTGGLGGFTLEPWTPLDTATWQKVQAWSLGGNVDSEIFRFLADARLGSAARTDELFPPYDPAGPVITPSGLAGSGGAGATAGQAPAGDGATAAAPPATNAKWLTAAHVAALGNLGRLGSSIAGLAGFDRGAGMAGDHGIGSNNWVVAGDHTLSGKPVLANDPHLGFSMPAVWILNGLHCRTVSDSCPWDVVGVSFPGAPAVILGHNARIAWGATNVGPDTQDLFEEDTDPTDPAGHYIHDGRSIAYDVRHETIRVAGADPVELDVRSTGHGVVLSDVDPRLADGPVLALRWTTTAEVDLALESFIRINTAATFEEFRAAFGDYGSPSQNFIYADVDGHIGYVLPGRIPVRAGPNGDRVRDGGSGDEEWLGYVPIEDLPWQLDPEGGQIVTANNAPVDATYPHWLGSEWDPGYRATRIGELLADLGDQVTADEVRQVQLDTYVPRSVEITRRLAAVGPRPTTEDGGVLYQRMLSWDDGECGVDSVGCAAYMTIELALQRKIFDDELGPIARDYVGTPVAWQALVNVLGDLNSAWWDAPPDGAAGHDPARRAAEAIDAMAAELRGAYGDPANWTWGRLHTVTFRESTLGSSGILPLELYFNPPGRPVSGANGAIDNNYYRASDAYPDPADPKHTPIANHDTFQVTNGPSLRFAIDMADLDAAQIIITTGQSGNAFDRHYGDMIPLWAEGRTVALPFSADNVAASAAETLTLRPSD
jgi:penicillin G amidase